MSDAIQQLRSEKEIKRKSALITFLISVLVFLAIFFYQFTTIIQKPEVVTTMLINFGDSQNGADTEEPADQDGSQASNNLISEVETVRKDVSEISSEPVKQVVREKILTGKNTSVSVPAATKARPKATAAKTSPAKSAAVNSKNGSGDAKGTAAIGNLIKGRSTKAGTQGTNGTIGNEGDPLGGDGNGDSTIGIDRKLIGYIPGTMGRGGSQPSHSCAASGSITISYTVDKNGNVISARRSGGISDVCVVSTSVAWVKKYVKAEKAPTSSSGTYRISF